MNNYPHFRLDELADVVAGDPAPQDPRAFAPDGPLFVRMQDVGRHHHNPALTDSADRLSRKWIARDRLRLFPKDSILIPKSGASVNLNHRAKLATEAYVVSHLAIIIPDRTRVNPDYLYWWSVGYDPRSEIQVTSLPSLRLSILKSAMVPLPPLEKQQKIVNILNRAGRIKYLELKVQERLREFIPAQFVKMFGDPTTNPMGWEICTLSEICEVDRQGIHPSYRVSLDLPFVGVENVESETGAIVFDVKSRSNTPKSTTFRFHKGHVLYAKLRPYLNKVATPDFSGRCSTELIPLLPRNGISRDFVAQLLRRKETVEYAMATATGSRMPRTDMRMLMLLPVPRPPSALQAQFTTLIDAVRVIESSTYFGSQINSRLSRSLMSRLIGGTE